MTARVYVNLPEGMFSFPSTCGYKHIQYLGNEEWIRRAWKRRMHRLLNNKDYDDLPWGLQLLSFQTNPNGGHLPMKNGYINDIK